MSDFQSNLDLQRYLDKLLEKSKPNSNDRRHSDYVRYINVFLSHFGDERAYLVGSTAEDTKLRFSLDNGDADFILVSGKLDIPVSAIECRAKNPSFVWIRGEHLDSGNKIGIDMIETSDGKKYLQADTLHDLDIRLFSILRGIYQFVTSNTDSVPGRETRVTTFGEKSSVGLARIQIRGLEIKDKDKIPQLRKYFPKYLRPRESKRQKLDKDGEDINRILELIALFGKTADSTEHDGQFDRFTDIVKLLLDRQKRERLQLREEEPIVQFSDTVESDPEITANDDDGDFEISSDLNLPSNVRATYKEKTMKDFVPALRVRGELHFMQEWFKENGKWLSDKVKMQIKNTEIYVVAKEASFDPNEKDFCLSFNHAEVILAKELTQTQRKCLLMLKAYHKGVFEKSMANYDSKINLKTFHLKTALYWVLEETGGTELWEDENLELAVCQVLQYLRDALLRKTLLHYFTKGNLFYGIETGLCLSLTRAIDEILENPVKGLVGFFDLEKITDTEITLTNEQVKSLIEMAQDGGAETQVNILEDVLEDFNRGFKEATKDTHGNSPLQQAMDDVMNMYLHDEAERKAKKELAKINIPAPENLGDILSGVLGNLLGSSSQQSAMASGHADKQSSSTGDLLADLASQLLPPNRKQTKDHPKTTDNTQKQESQTDKIAQEQSKHMTDAGRQNSNAGDLLKGLAGQLLQPSRQQRRQHQESADIPRRHESEYSEPTLEHGRQLASAVHAFFDPSSRGSNDEELKQLGLSYWLGKPE